MYELEDFEAMVADPRRGPAYQRALAATIRPGDHVLEIGTGVGHFAVEAARLGAAMVTAIDLNPLVELGPALARENGVVDRIRFVHGDVSRLTLDRRADVLVEDMRGVLPLLGPRFTVLTDVRARLLVPDARLVTQRDTVWMAPTVAPRRVRPLLAPTLAGFPDLQRGPGHARLFSQSFRAHHEPADLCAAAEVWLRLDYAGALPDRYMSSAEFDVPASSPADGVSLWFSAELAGGAGFSSEPGSAILYGQLFYPFRRPLHGHLRVTMEARLVRDQWIYRWHAEGDGATGVRESLEASTLGEALPGLAQLRATSASGHPRAGERAAAMQLLLTLADGTRSLDAIAEAIAAAQPAEFATAASARQFASFFLPLLADDGRPRDVGER